MFSKEVTRSRGALICALFGTGWFIWAASFTGTQSKQFIPLVAILGIALIIAASRRLRAARKQASTLPDGDYAKNARKTFLRALAAEWIAACVGIFLLSRFHQISFLPQLLSAIVALHFLPLARGFQLKLYYATSAVMLCCVLLSFFVEKDLTRNLIVCGGAGITLWATSLALLLAD